MSLSSVVGYALSVRTVLDSSAASGRILRTENGAPLHTGFQRRTIVSIY